jgi:hypothetical protein
MAEVHTNITIDNSGSKVVFHNPGQHPLPAGAGQPITTVKTSGSTSVQGQVPNSSVVISNPA